MKNQFLILTALFAFLFSGFVFGQEEPEVPEPPATPDEPEILYPAERYAPFFKLSEEKEKKLLKELNEELKANLLEIKKHEKEEYFELLRESQYRNMRHPFATKREKEMLQRERRIFELEIATKALSTKYNNAKSGSKSNLRSKLSTTISELFDLKELNRKAQVKQLELELKKLKKELDVRSKNKDEIIRRRVQELLGEDDYLDWD